MPLCEVPPTDVDGTSVGTCVGSVVGTVVGDADTVGDDVGPNVLEVELLIQERGAGGGAYHKGARVCYNTEGTRARKRERHGS